MTSDPPPKVSREVLRYRRAREVRKSTASPRDAKRHLKLLLEHDPASTEDLAELDALRPKTRADCEDGLRPCPFVSCRWNLFLDISDAGGIIFNLPDIDPDQMVDSCVLDVADAGGATLEEVGALLNVTRERIRQIEARALVRLPRRLRADLEMFTQDRETRGEAIW